MLDIIEAGEQVNDSALASTRRTTKSDFLGWEGFEGVVIKDLNTGYIAEINVFKLDMTFGDLNIIRSGFILDIGNLVQDFENSLSAPAFPLPGFQRPAFAPGWRDSRPRPPSAGVRKYRSILRSATDRLPPVVQVCRWRVGRWLLPQYCTLSPCRAGTE